MIRSILIAAAALLAALAQPAAAAFKSDRITVTTEGSGPDVILIPGLTSSPRIWKSTVAAVPGYRYHLVQVLGFAGTPAGANATGPVAAPVAEEIARYIAEEKLGAPAVIGHSMGGTIGLMLAARHPNDVSKLMVVDMMPYLGPVFAGANASPGVVSRTADMIRYGMLKETPEQRHVRTADTVATMVKTESERAAAIADGDNSDPQTVANAFHELIVTNLHPELKNIRAPLTVLYVRAPNVPFTDEQVDALYKASYADVPGAKLVRVPDSYHFIMLDAPERFQSEVKQFLAH